jgi:hypothetical protein
MDLTYPMFDSRHQATVFQRLDAHEPACAREVSGLHPNDAQVTSRQAVAQAYNAQVRIQPGLNSCLV